MKKLVLFDIDYTIFDTDAYRDIFYPRLAAAIGIEDKNEFWELAKKARAYTDKTVGYYKPEVYLTYLVDHAQKNTDLATLEAIFWNTEIFTACLEKGVIDVVKTLVQHNIEVGILSTGDMQHQRKKVEQIHALLGEKHIHIFNNKITELPNVLAKYTDYQVFIIDDLPLVLATAKKSVPNVMTIWRKRDKVYESTDAVEGFVPDLAVSHVTDALNFILNA